jgi:gamma-glutamyltranspeptidase
MGIQAAIAAPRIDCSGDGMLVSVRSPASVVAGLERLGHRVEVREQSFFGYPFATALGALVDAEGGLHGGVDPYDASVAAGY